MKRFIILFAIIITIIFVFFIFIKHIEMKQKSPMIIGFSKNSDLSIFNLLIVASQKPYGVILFGEEILGTNKYDIVNGDGVKKIKNNTNKIKKYLGNNIKIFIDQEGGRVQQMKITKAYPSAGEFGVLYDIRNANVAKDKIKTDIAMLAKELKSVGFTGDMAPVADINLDQTNHTIGYRSFANPTYSDKFRPQDVAKVVDLSETYANVLLENAIEPVFKHIPGYGRAIIDSHIGLPVVFDDLQTLEETDFKVFHDIFAADKINKKYKYGMMTHVIYNAIDKELPATLSKKVIDYVRNNIGFDNRIIISDAIEMEVLLKYGTFEEIIKKTYDAGIDIVLFANLELDSENIFVRRYKIIKKLLTIKKIVESNKFTINDK